VCERERVCVCMCVCVCVCVRVCLVKQEDCKGGNDLSSKVMTRMSCRSFFDILPSAGPLLYTYQCTRAVSSSVRAF
jgi:hypothetical protein